MRKITFVAAYTAVFAFCPEVATGVERRYSCGNVISNIKKTQKTPDEDLELARRNEKKHERSQ